MNFLSFYPLSKLPRYVYGFALFFFLGLVCFFLITHSFVKKNPTAVQSAAESRDVTLYILGGSTALGEPYNPRADIGKIVSYFFGGKINGRPIRVVNMGYCGKDARGVLRDSQKIAGQIISTGTTIALLYLGNNEFLKYDKEHHFRKNGQALFEKSTLSSQEKKMVFKKYKELIEEIIINLKQAGLTVIASTIATNMKDWEPNRSVVRNRKNKEAVKNFLSQGNWKDSTGDVKGALDCFLAIIKLEPLFAIAHKRAGDCYRHFGDFDTARKYYQNAIDFDGNPYRETSEQREILMQVCNQHNVPVVDAVNLLENASPDHLIGFNLMWDNCHPTLEGYALIASGFTEVIEKMFNDHRKQPLLDLKDIEKKLGIDHTFKGNILVSRGQCCYAAATLTWDPTARYARSRYYLDNAAQIIPTDVELLCSFAVLNAMQNKKDDCLNYLQKAYKLNPETTNKRIKNPYVAEILQQQGMQYFSSKLR